MSDYDEASDTREPAVATKEHAAESSTNGETTFTVKTAQRMAALLAIDATLSRYDINKFQKVADLTREDPPGISGCEQNPKFEATYRREVRTYLDGFEELLRRREKLVIAEKNVRSFCDVYRLRRMRNAYRRQAEELIFHARAGVQLGSALVGMYNRLHEPIEQLAKRKT
ncbi:hypothetical protein GALMADRAFT_160288 [Galerina marginata CBS 339.88]|uniref:SPX domain-containing protein n=1 Tax=Galerina marginata (strain CBS 339.88) TaxID=685588 RepID=A0A067SQ26_GALM3|nr:hypothetical protein GALMADRAFT_160288 [Galerina marginata CBS 339.88]